MKIIEDRTSFLEERDIIANFSFIKKSLNKLFPVEKIKLQPANPDFLAEKDFLVHDLKLEDHDQKNRDKYNILTLPLSDGEKYFGKIVLFFKPDYLINDQEKRRILNFLIFIIQVLENKKRLSCDRMTYLYNKQYFLENLTAVMGSVIRHNRESTLKNIHFSGSRGRLQRYAVIMLDIDNFKSFNTNFGHLIGDRVLINIARIISEHCRENESLSPVPARFGGEEFIISLVVTDRQEIYNFAETLRTRVERFSREYLARDLYAKKIGLDFPSRITVSIGAHYYLPKEDDLLSDLYINETITNTIEFADIALQVAKENGKNRTVFYDEILSLAGRLVRLVGNDEAIINLGRVHGVEPGMVFNIIDREFNGTTGFTKSTGAPGGIFPKRVKGQLVINSNTNDSDNEIQENISIGRIINLKPGWNLQIGDILELAPAEGREKDEDLELLKAIRLDDPALRKEIAKLEQVSLLLVEISNYEKLSKIFGRSETDRLIIELETLIKANMDSSGRIQPFSRNGLAIIIPGFTESEAEYFAKKIQDTVLQYRRPHFLINIGIATCPGNSSKTNLIENAKKSLIVARNDYNNWIVSFSPEVLNQLGSIYYHKNMINEAFTEFKAALNMQPDSSAAHNNLGIIYWELGLIDQAIAEYRKALELAPDNIYALNNLAYLYSTEEGQQEKAIQYYEKALEYNIDYPVAFNNLAHLYLDRGKNKINEAIELSLRAVKLEPSCGPFWDTLSRAYYKKGNLEASYQAIMKARKLMGDNCEIMCHLARVLKDRGMYPEAEEVINQALARDPAHRTAKRIKFELKARREYL